MNNSSPKYDKDFYAWTLYSAKLLRQGKFEEVDIKHVAEEIESMGKCDKSQLMSRLIVLIAHLLKGQFQSERRGKSWRRMIVAQRIKIPLVLKDSPSFRHELNQTLVEAYHSAIQKIFPGQCPYSLEQCLSQEFFPE